MELSLDPVAADWLPIVCKALAEIDGAYLSQLQGHEGWLPGKNHIFNAFSLPLANTHTILLGESPYPRTQSANGYAFWDAAVCELWSEKGLAKPVNRATSLRNFIKMLLHAEGALVDDFSQTAIAKLDKSHRIASIDELFGNLMHQGVLLLNASLVLSDKPVQQDAKAWLPFLQSLFWQLSEIKPSISLLLFGKIAQKIAPLRPQGLASLEAEHPYNLSFITNPKVNAFFEPMNLLHASR